MKIKTLIEDILKKGVNISIQLPSASISGWGLEKMPQSLKKAR